MRTICPCCCVPKRYIVTFLAFFGCGYKYLLRTNLSMAIVQMTSNSTVIIGNETHVEPPEFDWSPQEKGFIMSLFSYGYMFAPFGGMLATRFGGATIFGLGVSLTGLLSTLSPWLLRFSFILFCTGRILQGLFEGFIVAGYIELFVHWAPPDERTRLIVFTNIGGIVGTVINYPLTGFLAHKYGWESIFYVSGGTSLIWYAIWIIVVRNNPDDDWCMSKKEKLYLKEKINYLTKDKITYPWRKILTSKAVWAYLNDCFVWAWAFAFVVYCFPLYVKDTFEQDIENIGLISSVPNTFSVFVGISAACLADYLRSRKIISIDGVHKLYIIIGQMTSVFMLVITAMWTDFTGSVICFSILRCAMSFAETSYEVLPVDISLRYASVVYGLSVTTFSIGSFLSPLIMGFMVANHTRWEWNQYFLVLSVLSIWASIVFWFWGSGEVQSWAKLKREDDDEKEPEQLRVESPTCKN